MSATTTTPNTKVSASESLLNDKACIFSRWFFFFQ